MSYIHWYNGLIDKRDGELSSKKTYLSNSVKNLESKIIIAKEVPILGDVGAGKYMLYTSFRNYVELYRFIESVQPLERSFHEATLQSGRQKPRFDIDIKKADHSEFRVSNPDAIENFRAFGEYVKDLVIRTSLLVLQSLGVEASPSQDLMLFESHGEMKRSFHIVLNRYYQHGCSQAMAFYSACLQKCETELDRAIFSRFVDPGPYSRNSLLRLVWSGKQDGSEYRVKKYLNSYLYRGERVTHILPDYRHPSMTVRRMSILLHSLVSFTEEAESLPNLIETTPIRVIESEDIDDETFQVCKKHIEEWDTERAYCVLEAEGSIIRLERLLNSRCPLCERTHESNPFCYVNDRGLHWHCGRARGVGGILISPLSRGLSSSSLLERVNACRVSEGREGLEGVEMPVRVSHQTVFTVLGEDLTEAALKCPDVAEPVIAAPAPPSEVRKIVTHQRVTAATMLDIDRELRVPEVKQVTIYPSDMARLRMRRSEGPRQTIEPVASDSSHSGSVRRCRRALQLDWND